MLAQALCSDVNGKDRNGFAAIRLEYASEKIYRYTIQTVVAQIPTQSLIVNSLSLDPELESTAV